MLATGNSAAYAVERLIKAGVSPKNILFMALVAAPEGIEEFQKKHPTIHIYTASLDEKLNDHAYIVPGLGDAGDRLYGTK
jgi:uracil phosphoribosyltransferase